MKPELEKYAGMRICVALSGGRDSMALAHYLLAHAEKFNITLSALNCDHGIRGEQSRKDSAFVKKWCEDNGLRLYSYARTDGISKDELSARRWRLSCYADAYASMRSDCTPESACAIATAHHADDVAETVLFNISRGSGTAGAAGIRDAVINGVNIIRPLLSCSRVEIDEYVRANGVPFVDDDTNFSTDYTRNAIRLTVLPQLEKAVSGASENICRFSRLAAEDEDFFNALIIGRKIVTSLYGFPFIVICKERPLFKRAALKVIKGYGKTDYSNEILERLYGLQFNENGKIFNFLGLTACKTDGGLIVSPQSDGKVTAEIPLCDFLCGKRDIFAGQPLVITTQTTGQTATNSNNKTLKFSVDAIPENAVVRNMKAGDRFEKFGGGTKNLGDYFTDKKIPKSIRGAIPLIAGGNEILAVCGIEISDKIKVTQKTEKIGHIIY